MTNMSASAQIEVRLDRGAESAFNNDFTFSWLGLVQGITTSNKVAPISEEQTEHY